jgi:hypothetical protein
LFLNEDVSTFGDISLKGIIESIIKIGFNWSFKIARIKVLISIYKFQSCFLYPRTVFLVRGASTICGIVSSDVIAFVHQEIDVLKLVREILTLQSEISLLWAIVGV